MNTTLKIKDILGSAAFMPAYFVACGALGLVAFYAAWFGMEHNFSLSQKPEVWGQFGDYVGGVLNPLCAYMAFVWLVRSYALQKTELAETRQALEEGQKAQQEQARLALIAAQTQSLSIRLTAIGSVLSALRQSHARAVEHANQRGLDYAVVTDDGTYKPAKEAIPALYALIKVTEKAEDRIVAELNKLAINGIQAVSDVTTSTSK